MKTASESAPRSALSAEERRILVLGGPFGGRMGGAVSLNPRKLPDWRRRRLA
ncbi:MAG: hypothetical protein QOH04_2595 [Sphingomonadales bacterium]|jgi:hypothetical protein|nr:hypothetical protein [Sphingomonadales bacterium]